MSEPVAPSALIRWAFAVLRPIVRLLRASGVPDTIIRAQVDRALELHQHDTVRGRLDPPTSESTIRALSELLALWSRRPEWAGADGMPADLGLSEAVQPTFAALVATQPQGLAAERVLQQLEAFGAVARSSDGSRVRLLSALLLHTSGESFAAEPVLLDLTRFARTVEHNVFEKTTTGPGRLQQVTARPHVVPHQYAAFDEYLRRRTNGFLTDADDELARYVDPAAPSTARYGVGVYLFRDEDAPSE